MNNKAISIFHFGFIITTFCISLLFPSYTYSSPTSIEGSPSVYIVNVDANGQSINTDGSQNATVDPNQYFWFKVTIKNNGESWSGYGQLVIWVDGYSSVYSYDDNWFDEADEYTAGSTKYHKDGYQITTSEVSVEATEGSWTSGEEQTLEVRVKAPSSGSVRFLVRATFSDLNWNNIDSDPWVYTGYRDDQGHDVRRYTVNVIQLNRSPNEPYNEDPSDNSTNVSINADLDWSCSDPDGDSIYYH
ncbi:hypothetical protein ACFL2X_07055 [Candidatus Latescibacterota bacterium]